MSKSKKRLVPVRRFKEFENANTWEQRKLGEVATFLNGRAYKQDELLDSGKYKVLRVGNFYTNDSWYYSNMELGDKYYVDKGDLVYTWSATFGPHIWSGKKVIYHYHIWKVELSKFLDRNFTSQLLEADKARLLSSTNGSTMIHVTKGDMESKIVSIPNIDEQKQIGSFFKQLDNTITLHQRKLDKLKRVKSAYLTEMFPAEGEREPKRRFPGFTGAWEERKLGAITDSFSGGTPTAGKAEYYGGEIPFIRSGEISSDSTELFITDAGLNNSSAKMVGIGDILYALYGATSGETSISRINGAINQAILAIRPTKGDDPYMIVQWLKKQKETIISTYLQGGQGNLSGSIVKDLMITLPKNKDEQAKVGSFFKQLDQTITLHQRKIDKLKKMKAAYINEMFV